MYYKLWLTNFFFVIFREGKIIWTVLKNEYRYPINLLKSRVHKKTDFPSFPPAHE